MTGAQQRGYRRMSARYDVNKGRFEAFSDGVFAFAITLLILGIALPAMRDPTDAQLRAALLALWPNAVAYVLSFAVIGIMWQNHHALFRLVERIDRLTVALNLILLSGTVFIPFATTTLGTNPTLHASTFLYGCVLTYCSIAYNAILGHLIKTRAFLPSVSDDALRGTLTAYRVGLGTYVTATVVSLVFPLVSFALYVLITLYYFVPRGVDTDAVDAR